MKRGKKAQFYLIAAIIIIIVVVGLASIKNTVVTKSEPISFYDLGDNLAIEGSNIIDYGIFNQEDINEVTQNFTSLFVEYAASSKEENFDLTIIRGNSTNIELTIYSQEPGGQVSAVVGESLYVVTAQENYVPESTSIDNPSGQEQVKITLPDKVYNLNLKENQNFYFVMSKSEGFEKYVKENI